jgi:putative ABC transport system permease protein
MNIFKRFKKGISLRMVNLLGLSIVVACLFLSYSHIRKELSYDRFNLYADRIVRMTIQLDDDPIDGRVYDNEIIDGILRQMPEIEQITKLYKSKTGILKYQGESRSVHDFYHVSSNFFEVFSIPLKYGDKATVLQSNNQVAVSEDFARQLFGDPSQAVGKEFFMEGSNLGDMTVFVSGVFENFPETSHFHADLLFYKYESEKAQVHSYVYLLLKENTNIDELEQKLASLISEKELFSQQKIRIILMPLTDIHLHSRNLREMESNGNINYIYLIIGANLLLLTVVLFNLWLNASLLFSYNRRYYQLLRLHGASSYTVAKDEALLALLLGCLSLVVGICMAYYASAAGHFTLHLFSIETGILCIVFLLFTIFVSLLPVLKNISSTLFLNSGNDLKPIRFSYTNVKYMLTVQYAIVMITVILAFGISKQMEMVKQTQVGGNDCSILVTKELPWHIREKYSILKSELLKHPEILGVTAAFEIPGDAVRDMIMVKTENSDEEKWLPLFIAEADFFPFFRIKPVAGKTFSPSSLDFHTEGNMVGDWFRHKKISEITEEYLINRKAMSILGFNSPEEAIGKTLQIEHGTLQYINKGIICGVTDDFNYTGLHEKAIPMLIMQRSLFYNNIMVRFDTLHFQQNLETFNNVWNEINPDYPPDYTFMSDVFNQKYRNELNAGQLVNAFSLLCLIIADLGLIIFVAFLIKRRTREIGIRKVNGANAGEIVRLLNMDFIRWIALAFVIAVPVAWYIMHRWLENFAYRTSLNWWIFVLAGFAVLLISVASVSLQSWRAARTNPVEALKTE